MRNVMVSTDALGLPQSMAVAGEAACTSLTGTGIAGVMVSRPKAEAGCPCGAATWNRACCASPGVQGISVHPSEAVAATKSAAGGELCNAAAHGSEPPPAPMQRP
jgi:hypothetical protein